MAERSFHHCASLLRERLVGHGMIRSRRTSENIRRNISSVPPGRGIRNGRPCWYRRRYRNRKRIRRPGSPRPLPLFPTRPKSAIFPPIVRLKAPRSFPMLGSSRGVDRSTPTGSLEAVAPPPPPQNVACGFPAPRSSAVGSQLSLLSVQVSFPWSADLLSE